MGLVGISKKNKTKNVHLLKQWACLCKLVRRSKQRYAPTTPNKSFLIWLGSLTLRSNPILHGLVWSHQSKPMFISPHHFALTDWFSVNGLFLWCSSEYDNQSHNFKHLNFCDVTLVFSIDSVLQQSLAVLHSFCDP